MFKVQPLNQWPKWAVDGLNELALCEEKADDSRFFDGADEWTDKAISLAVKMANPTLTRLRAPVSGCYCLGAVAGHQNWMITHIRDLFPPDEILEIIIHDFTRRQENQMKILTKSQRASVRKQLRKNQIETDRLLSAFEKGCELKKAAIDRLLQTSISATGNERLEFWEGFIKASRRPAIPSPENMSPREKMLSAVLLGWRNVQVMKNRSVLRESLGSLFNQPDIYNHEFVQGICKEIELDLADRGRG